MDIKKFISLIKLKKQTIASIVILFFAMTAIFTFSQPLEYNSESSVLVVQNFPLGTDQSSISKSNEYISNILAKVVSSNLFYNDVFSAGYNIDKNYFSKKNIVNAEMEKWRKTVQAKAIGDTGIIDINVYHPDKQQLNQIAMAVNFILQSKHAQYHGLGSNVIIKIIDKPLISAWPTKPNIILNLLLAIVVGLIVAFYYIYLFEEASYNLKLWPKRKSRGVKAALTADSQSTDSYNQLGDFAAPKPAERKNENVSEIKSAAGGEITNTGAINDKDFFPQGGMNNLFRN